MRRVIWMLTMPVLTTLGLTACAPAAGRAAEPAEPTLERCLVSLIDEAKVPMATALPPISTSPR
jgi:hypothetical protein